MLEHETKPRFVVGTVNRANKSESRLVNTANYIFNESISFTTKENDQEVIAFLTIVDSILPRGSVNGCSIAIQTALNVLCKSFIESCVRRAAYAGVKLRQTPTQEELLEIRDTGVDVLTEMLRSTVRASSAEFIAENKSGEMIAQVMRRVEDRLNEMRAEGKGEGKSGNDNSTDDTPAS